MLEAIAALIAGFVLLVLSADRFVLGAAGVAKAMNISTLVIGMVVIGFGTSAPELLVSTNAAIAGKPSLAVGNALGSNIANLGLILGAAALLVPLVIESTTLRREYPVLVVASLLAFGLLYDGTLDRLDGFLLLGFLAIAMAWMLYLALHPKRGEPLAEEFDEEIPDDMPLWKALLLLFGGMAVLIGASKMLVWGAVEIATSLGISELVIGLTIVAIGTSLPELAAAISAALKKEPDLIIGNVIGSNLFNTLAVLAIPALFAPLPLDDSVMARDLPLVVGMTLGIALIAGAWRRPAILGRFGAIILLGLFVGYQITLYIGATGA